MGSPSAPGCPPALPDACRVQIVARKEGHHFDWHRRHKAIWLAAAGFGGRDGGKMVGLADPFLIVPSNDTPRIQEMHITLGHMLCGALEMELGLL